MEIEQNISVSTNFTRIKHLAVEFQRKLNNFSRLIDRKVLCENPEKHVESLFRKAEEKSLQTESRHPLIESQRPFGKLICESKEALIKLESPEKPQQEQLRSSWFYPLNQKRRRLDSSPTRPKMEQIDTLSRSISRKRRELDLTPMKPSMEQPAKLSQELSWDHQQFDSIEQQVDRTGTSSNVIKLPSPDKSKKSKRKLCPICNQSSSYLLQHMADQHSGHDRVNCPKCKKSLRPSSFSGHMKSRHKTVKSLPCKYCKKLCSPSYILIHMYNSHEMGSKKLKK